MAPPETPDDDLDPLEGIEGDEARLAAEALLVKPTDNSARPEDGDQPETPEVDDLEDQPVDDANGGHPGTGDGQ